jgi:hypothetical protein
MKPAMAEVIRLRLEQLLVDLQYHRSPDVDWQKSRVMQYADTDEQKLATWINNLDEHHGEGKNWSMILRGANKLHKHLKGLE